MYVPITHRTHNSHLRIGEMHRFTSLDFINFLMGIRVAEGEFHAPNLIVAVELCRFPDRGLMHGLGSPQTPQKFCTPLPPPSICHKAFHGLYYHRMGIMIQEQPVIHSKSF